MSNAKEPLNYKYQEILRLKAMLEEAGIPHSIIRRLDGWCLAYPKFGEERCIVAEHRTSYGAVEDRLEICGRFLMCGAISKSSDDAQERVIDRLTAENVYERISDHWKKVKNQCGKK